MTTDYSTWTDEQLDIAIAERVYYSPGATIAAWMVITEQNRWPRWTMHATSMLDLIEAMRKCGWWCRIESPAGDEETWWARFAHPQGPRSHARAATPQRAVCIAALMALDAETK